MKNIIVNSKQIEIIKESVKERLAAERKKVNTNPTDAQCKAENYAMGHICIKGFEITIENPKGSYRRGRDKSGKEWKTYMHNDYGYFTKTVGKDGDAIDVFIGPNIDDDEIKIFPIDQFLNGEFDETKVMMGFRDKESAKSAYLSNYEKDWKGFKYISEVDIDTFKKWLYDGYRQRKPFAKYASLTESISENNFFDDKMQDIYEERNVYILLQEFENDRARGIKQKQWKLIPAQQYQALLRRYMSMGEMARIPENIVSRWFEEIIMPNAVDIELITSLAGHSQWFPKDDIEDFYGEDVANDYSEGSDFLDKRGFYDWCKFPDGSDAWSDYGLSPIFKAIKEYSPSLSGSEILILINRVLDIVHCRGDLASAFIEGGKRTCWNISNDNELSEHKNEKNSKCDKCGGKIVLQIHGEPVYICKNCGKYFGTMPFNEKLMNELNESFKSPKLHRMSKENGGLSVMVMNGERSGNEAFKHGYTVPASEITDDMIGDTFTKDDPNYYKKYNNSISFNNGVSAELKNIENLPYVKKPHYWEHTEDNRGWSGMDDRDDFPEINDNQTPFGVGPCYTKVKGKYYQNTSMSRHGANIGDTGRHIPMTESELREKIFEAISDALKNL